MADFLTEYPFFVPFLSIVLTLIGTILGFYYFSRTTKQKAVVDKQNYKIQVERAMDDKKREEMSLAKELKEDNKRLALDVKEAMVQHVSTIVSTLKADIELQKTILLSEISLMKKDYSMIRNDMMGHIEHQQSINERMQKSIDFMNQFLWGAGAKSVPSYLEGEDETKEHRDKPGEGIFMSPDSTETQIQKNNAASRGIKSNKSEKIADEVKGVEDEQKKEDKEAKRDSK